MATACVVLAVEGLPCAAARVGVVVMAPLAPWDAEHGQGLSGVVLEEILCSAALKPCIMCSIRTARLSLVSICDGDRGASGAVRAVTVNVLIVVVLAPGQTGYFHWYCRTSTL